MGGGGGRDTHPTRRRAVANFCESICVTYRISATIGQIDMENVHEVRWLIDFPFRASVRSNYPFWCKRTSLDSSLQMDLPIHGNVDVKISIMAISTMCVCVCVAQGCCSASRSLLRSLLWGTTGGASSPPRSAPSYSECWRCGTRRKVRDELFLYQIPFPHFESQFTASRCFVTLLWCVLTVVWIRSHQIWSG